MNDIHGGDGAETGEPLTSFPPPGSTHIVLPMSPEDQTLADRAKNLLFDAELSALVVEHLPDAIVIVDGQGVIQRVNARAELLFGYPRAELVGQEIGVLIPDRLRKRHSEHIADYMTDPHMRPMGLGLDLKAHHKTGAEIPVDINLSPVVTTRGVWVIAVVRRKR